MPVFLGNIIHVSSKVGVTQMSADGGVGEVMEYQSGKRRSAMQMTFD